MNHNAIFLLVLQCTYIMVTHGDERFPAKVPKLISSLGKYIRTALEDARNLFCQLEWVKQINHCTQIFKNKATKCKEEFNNDTSTNELVHLNDAIARTSKKVLDGCGKRRTKIWACAEIPLHDLWPLINEIGMAFSSISMMRTNPVDSCKGRAVKELKKQIDQVMTKVKKQCHKPEATEISKFVRNRLS